MKLTAILLVICLHVGAKGFSQSISLSAKNILLEEVFSAIEKQSGYFFFYKYNELKQAKAININIKNSTIEEALSQSLMGQPFTYSIRNKTIVITRKRGAAVSLQDSVLTIKGQVYDTQSPPKVLAGVNIKVKGKNTGATTDGEGNFTIKALKNDVLIFSMIGFSTFEAKVGSAAFKKVNLVEEQRGLDQIVVIGYGTQKKVNLTGAVATVTGEVFESRPITTVSSGLQGALPGVTVVSQSGQPGRPRTSIKIRGINTLNSGSDPLILIDGVAGGSLDMLNPDDIESISVLKDAASSAIYGARAANGVLLVTTKSGKKGDQLSVNYSGYVGFQKPTRLPELVNGRDYMTLLNEARQNAGLAITYLDDAFTKYDTGSDPNDYSNTNWIGEIYKKQAVQTSHSINVNGSNGNTGYFMSYGYLNQDGLVVGDAYKSGRNNIRLRLNTQLFNRLKLDGNISYVSFDRFDNAASGTAGVFRLAQRISPLVPVKWLNPVAGGGWSESENYAYGSVSNPVDVARNSGSNRFKSKSPSGNLMAELGLIDGLKISGQYAFSNTITQTKQFSAAMLKYKSDGTEDAGNATLRNSISSAFADDLSQTFTSLLTYEKSFGAHNVKALAGYSQEWGFTSSLSGSRKNITLEGVEELDLGTEDIENSGTETHWALRSYFGRFNYNYKERYLFEANIRRDGTSRFARNKRWGTFPSFSAGWRLTEEPIFSFIKPVVSSAKIRASFGQLGNQNVGADNNLYPYLTSITRILNAYPIGNAKTVGFSQATLGNQDLIWEMVEMTNVGADLEFLRNRLSVTGDWFVKNNKGALLKPIYPSLIGFTSTSALPLVNMGKVQSKGWELSVGWRDQVGQFRYSALANLSDVKNKVVALGKSSPTLGENLIREGDPLNAYFGYLTDGLAQASDFGGQDPVTSKYINPSFPTISSYTAITQPGDIKYKDISGPNGVPDGIISSDDRAIIGNPNPRYTYSFRAEVGWKGFDLSFYLQGVGKVNGYVYDEAVHAFINDYSIPQTVHLDRWTPNNNAGTYPRLYYAQSHNKEFSDYWIQNASYLRLKNLQVGYTLPADFTKKANIGRARIYLSADNLFTRSDYFYAYDPEVNSTSGDAYPQVKTVVLGALITFK